MSDTACPSSRRRAALTALAAGRILMGALFIYMGLSKALHPVAFLKLVRQYEMVSSPLLLNLIAAVLPWFEVFCGAVLVLGVATRGAALLTLGMLAPFTGLVARRALALQAAGGLPFCAVRFDCGCGAGEVYICHKLAENTLLMALAAALLVWGGRKAASKEI